MKAQADVNAYEALSDKSASIAEAVLADASWACPGYDPRVPGATREDLAGHISAYAAALATGSMTLWLHHLAWAKACMVDHGMSRDTVRAVMSLLRDKLLQALESEAVVELWNFGLDALPVLPEHIDCSERPDQPHAAEVSEYVRSMLRFDKHSAWDTARSTGLPVPELYMHVLGPAQGRIGQLWQAGKITPAQEHYCTAATSELMVLLRATQPVPHDGRCVVAATVAGDQHDIGIRMVADMFEYNQWVTLFLGSNVPAENIAEVADEYGAAIVALSVSMTSQLPEVARVADSLEQRGSATKVLVGGVPLLLAPELWKLLGADATAPDAVAGVDIAAEVTRVT